MKKLLAILFSITTTFCFSQNGELNQSDIIKLITNTAIKLESLESLSYTITRELNYASENYFHIDNWDCYFSFEQTTLPIHMKFHIEDKKFKTIYNGTEYFYLDKDSKTINHKKTT